MEKSTLNKLLLSKSLYFLAKENITATSGPRLSIACNLLQDSVESFLLGLSDFLNAEVTDNTKFDKYFELINSKISPKQLPYKARLIALNKLRVNSKHYGLEPSKHELEQFALTVSSFLEETTKEVFSKDFATISLTDTLSDGESKDLLKDAEAAYEASNYQDCLVKCRQALFVKFESDYDAKPYLNQTAGLTSLGLLALSSKVPYYARNKDYLDSNVKTPTDFVIYDYNTIEMDLIKAGIDSLTYWNVCRLTPGVYRSTKEDEWIVKHQFRILESDDIKNRAEYVLSSTAEVLLKKDQSSRRTKSLDHDRFYFIPKKNFIHVYQKASSSSVSQKIDLNGITKVFCDFYVDSIDQSGLFWHVSHWTDEIKIHGFVHESEVQV